jgi:GNAT superfamily N-acetyltransferase
MPSQTNSSLAPIRDKSFHQQVASLHIAGISQGFLPLLGTDFMVLLYRAIDGCSSSVVLTECVDGKVLGFVSGAYNMKAIYRQLMGKPVQLLLSLLPSLFRPYRLKRIFEVIRYGVQLGSEKETSLSEFELLSIVVDPVARGTGCADRLYQHLISYCRSRGIESFRIVVGDTLSSAHSFYVRMGAVPVGRVEVHSGESSIIYVQKVSMDQVSKND